MDGKFCFKKQADGMVGSVVVGFAGAPCIEAPVLTAVSPGSNPASDGLLLRVIPPLSFYLSCPLKGIKKIILKNGRMDESVDKSMVGEVTP